MDSISRIQEITHKISQTKEGKNSKEERGETNNVFKITDIDSCRIIEVDSTLTNKKKDLKKILTTNSLETLNKPLDDIIYAYHQLQKYKESGFDIRIVYRTFRKKVLQDFIWDQIEYYKNQSFPDIHDKVKIDYIIQEFAEDGKEDVEMAKIWKESSVEIVEKVLYKLPESIVYEAGGGQENTVLIDIKVLWYHINQLEEKERKRLNRHFNRKIKAIIHNSFQEIVLDTGLVIELLGIKNAVSNTIQMKEGIKYFFDFINQIGVQDININDYQEEFVKIQNIIEKLEDKIQGNR